VNGGFEDPAIARQRRRVGLWALVAKALLLAVLLGAWWLWEQGGAPSRAAGGLPAASLDGSLGAAPAGAASSASSAATPQLPAVMATAAASAGAWVLNGADAASQAAASAGTTELCGVGRIQAGSDPPHLFEHAVQAAWPRVLAALAQSPAERARAAALVLRFQLRLTDAQTKDQLASPAEDTRAALAAMALQSSDPAVLGWAWSLCRSPGAPAACQQLSVPRWTARAPAQVQEDAALWLLLATAEPAQTARAVQGVVRATQFGASPAMTPWVAAALPADLPPYLRLVLLLQVQGLDLSLEATETKGLDLLTRHCRAPHLDGGDAADCRGLAETLAQRSSSVTGLAMSHLIGEVHGWSQARQDAMQVRVHALAQAAQRGLNFGAEPLGCASVERAQQFFLDRAAGGEVAALSRFLAPAGPAGAAAR
jgi:hypothetical protein